MAYRDARAEAITDADSAEIEAQLVQAYRALRASAGRVSAATKKPRTMPGLRRLG
jgi:hypothetical protein